MGDDKKEGKKDDEDQRLEFIFNYLIKSMKMKNDKWVKMLNTDEYMRLINNFFNNPEVPRLVLHVNAGGLLVPSVDFPITKSKVVYLLRKLKEVVIWENFKNVLSLGDMSPRPIEELAVLVEDVFCPLLTNPANQGGWPNIIKKDIADHCYAFKNSVYQIKGALHSETLLPLPPGNERNYEAEQQFYQSNGEILDLPLKVSIEETVILWGKICSDILKELPTVAFSNGACYVSTNDV